MAESAIRLTWDQSSLDAFVGELPKRLAYANVNSVRETLTGIQQLWIKRTDDVLEIRNRQFFFGSAARPGGAAARITTMPSLSSGKGIGSNGVVFGEIEAGTVPRGGDALGGHRSLLFTAFEFGGTRTPFTPGAKSVAAPRTGVARPSEQSAIDPALTFAKMQLRAYYRGKKLTRQSRSRKAGTIGMHGRTEITAHTPGVQWKGKNRTFLIFTKAHPRGVVKQRTGKGEIRTAWSYIAPFQIPPELGLIELAQSVGQRLFLEAGKRQVQEMLSHDTIKALRSA